MYFSIFWGCLSNLPCSFRSENAINIRNKLRYAHKIKYKNIQKQRHQNKLFQQSYKMTDFLPENVFRESCKAKGSSNISNKSTSAAAEKRNIERQRDNKAHEMRAARSFQLRILSSTKFQIEIALRDKERARKEAFKLIINRESGQSKKKARKMYTEFCQNEKDRETEVTYESDDSEMRDVYEWDQNIEDTKNHLSCTVEMLQTVTKKMQAE